MKQVDEGMKEGRGPVLDDDELRVASRVSPTGGGRRLRDGLQAGLEAASATASTLLAVVRPVVEAGAARVKREVVAVRSELSQAKDEVVLSVDELFPGDHIYVKAVLGVRSRIVSHHAIYVGDVSGRQCVVHYFQDKSAKAKSQSASESASESASQSSSSSSSSTSSSSSSTSAKPPVAADKKAGHGGWLSMDTNIVRLDTVEDMARGLPIWRVHYDAPAGGGEDVLYAPEEVVRRALSRVGQAEYNLVTNNCEHFCSWCKRDKHASRQVKAVALGAGVVAAAAIGAGVLGVASVVTWARNKSGAPAAVGVGASASASGSNGWPCQQCQHENTGGEDSEDSSRCVVCVACGAPRSAPAVRDDGGGDVVA